MSRLEVHLFGTLMVHLNGNALHFSITPILRRLFSYLLLNHRQTYPRHVLIENIWENHEEIRARQCLNSALWRLRNLFEIDGTPRGTYIITTTADEVGFNWECNHFIDLMEFERNARTYLRIPFQSLNKEQVHCLEKTLNLYKGDLLPGLFDEWVIRERERMRYLYLSALSQLMMYHIKEGQYQKSLECGQTILQLDPLREDIHRNMMRVYSETGQRALAIRQYESCRDFIRRELGITPMPETETLYTVIAQNNHNNEESSDPLSDESYIAAALSNVNHALQLFIEGGQRLRVALSLLERVLNQRG